ncbi:hypothetical protein GCM10027258_80340 [Amycolatopsis stemonae]
MAITVTQRWRDGLPRWRPVADGGFDPDRYVVDELTEERARAWTLRHHYSSTWPVVRLRTGLFDTRTPTGEPQLVGVLAMGVPMSNKVLTGVFPALTPHYESIEISRLCLADSVPSNGESWFCARSFDLAAERGVRGLVAFSDPVERWRGSELIKPGHCGIVYQALNFAYLGRSTPRTLTLLPDATVLTARAQAKVTGRETGAAGVIARLVGLGATPPEPDADPRHWLRVALREIGCHRVRHPGNHRYALRIGRTRGERTRTAIGMVPRRYPKPDRQLPLPPIP